ncbi:MAG TPA: glycerol dehydrogenase, partial [Ramlibacter sp.]|nr:glycerol dehydrogenase [Ramlibacter sp.]
AGSLHGEHVAYGLLVQLALEDRPAREVQEILALYAALGLPRRLAELRLAEATPGAMDILLEGAMGSPSVRRFHRPLQRADLERAIATVESWDAP